MDFRYKKDYLKCFDHYAREEKELIVSTDKQIRDYYVNHSASYGLRIKKLYQDGKDKIFEARASDKMRILWVESKGLVIFSTIGSHDEIRRCIKHYQFRTNSGLY